ncbi:MAG TPA: hypothetical protein VIY07_07985, partial [Pseudolabrys sp.]
AMRKLLASAVILAILSSPAFAQLQPKKEDDPLVILEKEKQKQAEALDKQYKRMMDRSRKDAETPKSDPWSNMRTPNDSKR